MSRKFLKSVIQQEVNRTVEIECDMCGAKAVNPHFGDWSKGKDDIARTIVMMEKGSSNESGGSKRTVAFDICPVCFEHVLMAHMREWGVDATVKEEEW